MHVSMDLEDSEGGGGGVPQNYSQRHLIYSLEGCPLWDNLHHFLHLLPSPKPKSYERTGQSGIHIASSPGSHTPELEH